MYNQFNRTTNHDDDEAQEEAGPFPGSPGWEADQLRAQQAQEAKARKEAARNQPAPVPQSAKDRAFAKAAKVYDEIMTAEEAKTAAQREVEDIERQIEELSAQMQPMWKEPTRFKKERAELEPKLAALFKRHDELTAQPRKPHIDPFLTRYT